MHAGLLHLGDGHDGAFQLAFHGAPVIHAFGEVGDAEIGFVEDLEADSSRFRQT